MENINQKPTGQNRGKILPFTKKIMELRKDGFSYRQIADFLEKEGCKTSIPTIQRLVAKQQVK